MSSVVLKELATIIVGAAAFASLAFAPTASAASDEYEAGYDAATHNDGLAYKLLAAGGGVQGSCRTATTAFTVDFPKMDLKDYYQGCIDGMEAQGWR